MRPDYFQDSTFTVESFDPKHQAHLCRDDDGHVHAIDLRCSFPPGTYPDPEDLVGKRVRVSSCFPMLSIAMSVVVQP